MTTTTLTVAPKTRRTDAAKHSEQARRRTLLVVMVAFVLDLMDATILTIALPTIRRTMHASSAAVDWMAASYTLSFAVLLLLGGRLGDRFGYRRLFVAGVSGFLVSSLLVGVAPSVGVLIAARLVQGAMAALMVPQVLSVIQILYRPAERTTIMGMLGGLSMLATTIAPIVTALVIKANFDGLSWRPVFLINIPICLAAIGLATKHLPDAKQTSTHRLDLRGTGLAVLAAGTLVLPLVEGHSLGWPAWVFFMMVAAVPLSGAFVVSQRRARARGRMPLVLPELFRHRSFSVGLVLNGLLSATVSCFALTFTLLLQVGHNFTPIHAVLTALFITAGIVPTAGALSKSVIPALGRYALTLGTIVIAAGIATVGIAAQHEPFSTWKLAPGLFVLGAGMGLCFTSLLPFVLSSIDRDNVGSASGTANAVQQIGGAFGIALAGAVFFSRIGNHTSYGDAFGATMWLEVVLLVLAAALSALLPRRISADAYKPTL
jgi:EmrB/QacA subfamily drug resistance transporter